MDFRGNVGVERSTPIDLSVAGFLPIENEVIDVPEHQSSQTHKIELKEATS